MQFKPTGGRTEITVSVGQGLAFWARASRSQRRRAVKNTSEAGLPVPRCLLGPAKRGPALECEGISVSNSNIIRGAYAAFASGDIPQVLATCNDDIVWVEAAGYIYGGTYTGAEAIVQNVFTRLGSEWNEFLVEPDTLLSEGDQVAALGWFSGTYKATDIAFRARFVHWFTMADGRVSRFESIPDSVKVAEAVSP